MLMQIFIFHELFELFEDSYSVCDCMNVCLKMCSGGHVTKQLRFQPGRWQDHRFRQWLCFQFQPLVNAQLDSHFPGKNTIEKRTSFLSEHTQESFRLSLFVPFSQIDNKTTWKILLGNYFFFSCKKLECIFRSYRQKS